MLATRSLSRSLSLSTPVVKDNATVGNSASELWQNSDGGVSRLLIKHQQPATHRSANSAHGRFSRRLPHASPVASSSFIADLFGNEPLVAASAACVVAQLLKPVLAAAAGDGFNWRLVVKSGGMPSSHSAVVTALATSIYFDCGASDPLFGMAVVFATIVMYDAQGVRAAVGKQAQVINSLVVPQLVPPHPLSSSARNGTVSLSRAIATHDTAHTTNGTSSSRTTTSKATSRTTSGSTSGSSSSSSKSGQAVEQRGWKGLFTWPQRVERLGAGVGPGSMGEAGAQAQGVGSDNVGGGGRLTEKLAAEKEWDESHNLAKGIISSTDNSLESSRWRWQRTRNFWAAVGKEPAVLQGEVEVQEIGPLEGWQHVPLKESVGHTKAEVVGGALAGIVLSLLVHEALFI
ncbi:hypothetical protein CLOP_g11960 [Closterium sp. NIES-67]|nr:hypothetical protein CLOP_g11960 [Closterium sp. NIES-67]